jgi:molybdenum cofactor cytidylyltransferase
VRFGRFPLNESEGAVSAHELRRPGVTLRKGQTIDAALLAALRELEVSEIVAARLEQGDIGENESAGQIATALAGPHVRAERPFTGRSNLFAEHTGLLVLDAAAVDAINDVDEAITLATLAPWRRVAEGDMVATVKIIPFAVSSDSLKRALEVLRAPILSVAPFRSRKIGVVSTILPGLKRTTIDKTLRNLESRLHRAGARITGRLEAVHESEALAATLVDVAVDSDLIVIFGASAIMDRRDVIPAAIEAAGGRVLHFGMPVDPGNLLLLAELCGRPVIGAPGCARSIKENGFDFVLDRLLAGLVVQSRDIRHMGVGGLLIEAQPAPEGRETAPARKRDGELRAGAALFSAK